MADDSAPSVDKPILVVEDDVDIRESLVMLLELEGFSVVAARDGLEALEWLEQCGAPSLVLLDLMMPRLDGLGFLERWRLLSCAGACPVIVASGIDMPEAPQGVDAVMRKPVSGEELLAAVRRHLAASKQGGGGS
jgi:CheY-like chemotaxis protein